MFLLITGGSASGKSWIAQEFAGKMDKEQSTIVLDCVAETLTEKIRTYQGEVLPQQWRRSSLRYTRWESRRTI